MERIFNNKHITLSDAEKAAWISDLENENKLKLNEVAKAKAARDQINRDALRAELLKMKEEGLI
jgi:hypothetical protein